MEQYIPPSHLSERLQAVCRAFEGFNRFCQANNLTYFACGGTAIGAVRHKGFIPWDGDVDVYMLREDYNKLLDLQCSIHSSNEWCDYELIKPLDKDFYHPYARWGYKHSTVWEHKRFPFAMGLYVDIFPLDYSPEYHDIQKIGQDAAIIWSKYQRSCIVSTREEITNLFKGELWRLKDIVKRVMLKLNKRNLIKQLKDTEAIYTAYPKGQYVYNFGYSPKVYENEVFKQEWFDGVVQMPFENITISMPVGYHEYLQAQYGDYMQLPPEDQRYTHNESYFVDCHQRLSLTEIRAIKGEPW